MKKRKFKKGDVVWVASKSEPGGKYSEYVARFVVMGYARKLPGRVVLAVNADESECFLTKEEAKAYAREKNREAGE